MIAEAPQKRLSRKRDDKISFSLEGLPAIYSIEAERSLLGAMLSEPETVIDLAEESGLRPEDFFSPAHQELYRAFLGMRNSSAGIDASTLIQYLNDRKLTEAIGGPALLGELAAGVVSVLTARDHIKTVKHKSILRSLQQACAKIVYSAQERQHEPEEVVDEAESLIFSIAENGTSQSVSPARKVVTKTLDFVIHMTKRQGKGLYTGMPTGLDDLDKLTTGFKPGEMIVIAARPGVGKTALALTMAKNFIKEKYDIEQDRFIKPGYNVGIFSLEMTNEQLMLRMLASYASLSMQKIREGKLSESEIAALSDVAAEVAELPLYLDESSSLSISQLRAKTRRMKQQYNIDVIIIDYLQLLVSTSEKARDNRQVEVSEISRGIKALANELKIPIIVLAQLNRKPEEGSGEPALHHLRESGSIEQDADVVMLLSRVENKEGEWETIEHGRTRAIKCRLNIAKQRNGPTDKIDLLFQGEYTRFDSMPRTAK